MTKETKELVTEIRSIKDKLVWTEDKDPIKTNWSLRFSIEVDRTK